MYEIVAKKELAPKIKLFDIYAPDIAEKAKPGQFIIIILDEKAERIPLTIAGNDQKKGTIKFAFNEVGKTTKKLGMLEVGESIWNVTGPLGNPSEIKNFGHVLCVAAGVMIAPMLFQVEALRRAGNKITTVVGARTKELLFFEKEMEALSDRTYVVTDDGSKGFKGLSFLKSVLENERIDRCTSMGPVVMMKRLCELTKPYGIPTVVCLTPIMVDGMGMCGACRVSVGGVTKFACVDGPEFLGHDVDFDLLVKRQRAFLPEERLSSLMWERS